jgi:hypothetical protein
MLAMLLIVQAASPIPRKASDAPASGNSRIQENASAQHKSSTEFPPTKKAEGAQTDKQSGNSPAGPDNHITVVLQQPNSVSGWEKAYVILTGLLVLVGAIGIAFAINTLKAVERQAKANEDQLTEIQQSAETTDRMILLTAQQAEDGRIAAEAAKDSASAALKNAQAIVDAERPWVFIEHSAGTQTGDPRNAHIQIVGRNRGRTPAKVTVIACDFAFRAYNWEFPSEPEYPKVELLYRNYVAPGEPFDVYDFNCATVLTDELWESYKGQRLTITGHVVYRDVFTDVEHETRFCYFLSPVPMVGLLRCGPRNYSEQT